MFSKGFIENYQKHYTFDEYFNDYKNRKQEQNKNNLENIIEYRTSNYLSFKPPRTLKNEIMRSKGEAEVANFLFTHGIEYKYEEPYPEKVDEENRAYRPDFTVEVNGIPLYIEYFGLSNFYNNRGGISAKDEAKYNRLREQKRAFHALKHNNYIELDYKKEKSGKTINFLDDLKEQLMSHGVTLKKITNEEIYNQILNNNVEAEFFRFIDFIFEIISNIKSSIYRDNYKKRIDDYILNLNIEENIKNKMYEERDLIIKVYEYYESKLLPTKIDFSDMIYYANKYMQNISDILDYEYIIIDEYQDISLDRYEFARKLSILSQAKVTSVGDDWQTIFSFAGSRIDLFLKYNYLFPGAKQLFINNTYRGSQELIDIAGKFIMKNPRQIKKELKSPKHQYNPIKYQIYDYGNEYNVLKYIITNIYKENPNHHILILARKNKHIKKMLESGHFSEGVGSRVILNDYPECIIDAMSIHSAKGLGADEVIILNVTNADFPCPEKENIWLFNLFKPVGFIESYPSAEERRVFYVALTRTKNNVYLLLPKDPKEMSPFAKELFNL